MSTHGRTATRATSLARARTAAPSRYSSRYFMAWTPSEVVDVDQPGRPIRRGHVLAALEVAGEGRQPLREALRQHAPVGVVVIPADDLADLAPALRRQVQTV